MRMHEHCIHIHPHRTSAPCESLLGVVSLTIVNEGSVLPAALITSADSINAAKLCLICLIMHVETVERLLKGYDNKRLLRLMRPMRCVTTTDVFAFCSQCLGLLLFTSLHHNHTAGKTITPKKQQRCLATRPPDQQPLSSRIP